MDTAHNYLTSCMAARITIDDAGTPSAIDVNHTGRIQLMPMGAFAARDGRPASIKGVTASAWALTPEIADDVVSHWQARTTPLVIDYEHQTINTKDNGQPAPAAGWIDTLMATPDGLYAAVTWTDRARAYIKADEYRYISPVFTFDPKTGAVLELKSAALTNYPALDGLDAVAAVVARAEDAMTKKLATVLRTVCGLPADATDDAVLAELEKLPADKSALAALIERDEQLVVLKHAEPDPASYVPAAMLRAEQEKAARLVAKVAELETGSHTAALAAEIDAALADGRLPRSCEGWARGMARTAPDVVKGYIGSAVPLAALSGTQTGTQAGGNPPHAHTATLTDEEQIACTAAGISTDAFIAAKAKEGGR